MKTVNVALLALATLASGRSVDFEYSIEQTTAYGYLERFGVPLANSIREAEEAELASGSRIVGSSAANLGQFPYQAGLVIQLSGGQAICGGSLLTTRRVVTAAHCWWDGRAQAQGFTVVLGSIRIFSGGTRITTKDTVMHESWNPDLIRNDIAMIRLPSAVTLSSMIAPIALPSGTQLNESFAGVRADASGFGITSDNAGVSTAQGLRRDTLETITNAVCSGTPNIGWLVQSSNICTSGAGGRSICRGDSGVPLAVIRNNMPLLIGITSFGHASDCQQGFPTVYARVTSFNTWIRGNL